MLNKICANLTQQHMTEWNLSQEYKTGLIFENQCKVSRLQSTTTSMQHYWSSEQVQKGNEEKKHCLYS